MPLLFKHRGPHRAALTGAGLYLLVAAVWIVASDRMVELIATSPQEITTLQTVKGWGFVLITGVALYGLIRREVTLIRRGEARLQVLAEQSLAGLFVLEDGRITDVNRRLLEMLGYDRTDELADTDLSRIIHSDDLERVAELRALAEGEGSGDRRFRVRMLRKSGEVMHADAVAGRIDLEGTSTTMGLVLDSTDQVELEEQLRRAQRMETLGQLTGAIAHDFNNFLTAIMGPLELCLDDLAPDHPSRDDVRLAWTTAERAANLSRQLLTFSRKRITRRHVFDLNRPIRELRPLLEQITGESVEMRVGLADELLPVVLDESQLEQVLMNLVINAVDAMPDGGELRIRTARVPGSPEVLRYRGDLDPGPHALLEVSDNGVGIPEDVRLQVFEPFFTTKSKGTGLGLSTVFGIVDRADGFIRVESEPGRGTTFRVFVPLTDRPLDAEEPGGGEAAPSSQATAGAAILLVEDEEVVRSVTARMLERAGYAVRAAADGESALRIWEDEGPFELLLTDLMLPGISGIDVAEHLRKWKPGLAVLFTSGYSEEALVDQVAEEFESQFLEKPFAMTDLEEKVRETLASARRA